jgi:hypothetical protein
VKFRSRAVAVAAAAGLVAGFLTLGTGTAHAADNLLLDCDRVAGTAAIKPPLTNVAQPNVAITTKGPLKGGGIDNFHPIAETRDCTGILATPGNGGTPDDVGPLTKIAAKFTGSATCNLLANPPITDPLDPLDGVLTLTYSLDSNPDPFTFKAWSSSTYVRIGQSENPITPDELDIVAGIVTKGAGVGADVHGGFVFAPYDAKIKGDFDANPATATTVRPNQSFIDANSVIQPGAGSAGIGGDCLAGTPVVGTNPPVLQTLATAFFSTDGTGLLNGVVNSSFSFTLPVPT